MNRKTFTTLILTDILSVGAYTVCMIMDNLYRMYIAKGNQLFSSSVYVLYLAGKIFEILSILIIPLAFVCILKLCGKENIKKIIVINGIIMNVVAIPVSLLCTYPVPVQDGIMIFIIPFAVAYALSHIILSFAIKNN